MRMTWVPGCLLWSNSHSFDIPKVTNVNQKACPKSKGHPNFTLGNIDLLTDHALL